MCCHTAGKCNRLATRFDALMNARLPLPAFSVRTTVISRPRLPGPLLLQVLRCYREAPTALARRSMFAVLYDHVVSGRVGAAA